MDSHTPLPNWPAGASHNRPLPIAPMAWTITPSSTDSLQTQDSSENHKKPRTNVREAEPLASSPAAPWILRRTGGQAVLIGVEQSPNTANGKEPPARNGEGTAVRAVCPRTGARMLELSWLWCPGVRRNAQSSDNHDVGQR